MNISLILRIIIWNWYINPISTEENTENKRSSPKSHGSNQKKEAAWETRLPNSKASVLSLTLCCCIITKEETVGPHIPFEQEHSRAGNILSGLVRTAGVRGGEESDRGWEQARPFHWESVHGWGWGGGMRSRAQWTGYRAFCERDALPSSKRRTRRDCCGKWHDLPSLPFLEKYSVKLSVWLSFWRWICVCSRYTSG